MIDIDGEHWESIGAGDMFTFLPTSPLHREHRLGAFEIGCRLSAAWP